MSNKIFEVDSDNDIEIVNNEPIEEAPEEEDNGVAEEVEDYEIKKIKRKTPAQRKKEKELLEPKEDNTKKEETDDLGEPIKKRKKRPPLTEERKAQLLKNLEAGRKKALETRKKKAQAKKILKKKKEEEMDNLIKEDLMAKKFEKTEKDKLRQDLDEMKLMMQNLMEENKRLSSSKPSVKEELPPQQKSEKPVPEAVPKVQTVETVKPPKIYRSKGITSRWSKYNKS